MAKKISKNNPASRDNSKLIIYCPDCDKEVKLVMVVNHKGHSKMMYECVNEKCKKQIAVQHQSYLSLRHEWIVKK